MQWSGIALAFFGITIAFLFHPAGSVAASNTALWGDALALLAGILWAATTIAVRLTKLAEAPATQTLFYQLLIAFLLLFPLAFAMGQASIHWTPFAIGSLLFHTIIVSFASYLIWFWLLKEYLASRLGVFSFLTPLFGVLFGVILLKEKIELNFIVGTVLVMLGIMVVSMQGWVQSRSFAKALKSD